MDLTEGFGDFFVGGVVEPGVEGFDDAIFRGEAGTDDEGKAEALAVAGVEGGELFVCFVAETIESESGLLAGGLGGEGAGAGEFASEIGMGADQGELSVLGGGIDRFAHDGEEAVDAIEWGVRMSGFGDPGGVLVDAAEDVDEVLAGKVIELG